MTAFYGRRGGPLKEVDKGTSNYSVARGVFETILREKLAKGYRLTELNGDGMEQAEAPVSGAYRGSPEAASYRRVNAEDAARYRGSEDARNTARAAAFERAKTAIKQITVQRVPDTTPAQPSRFGPTRRKIRLED